MGNALRFVFFLATGGRSSNGRTPDSGSGYLGSNPSLPANFRGPLWLPIADLLPLLFPVVPAFVRRREPRFQSPPRPCSIRTPIYSCGTCHRLCLPDILPASKKGTRAPASFHSP